jgi:hypothetical protein
VSTTNNFSLAEPGGQKNILLHKETVLIIGLILASLILVSVFFSFLWAQFKFGFVFLLAWLLIVITRRTDSWKMGIECYYVFTLLFAFAFNGWIAFFMSTSALLFVVKFFRPDELQGTLTQISGIAGIAATTHYFSAYYGPAITQSQLLFVGILLFGIWDFVRFLVALKISPAHWVKLFASFITGIFINYFYYITFAYPLLQFLLSV